MQLVSTSSKWEGSVRQGRKWCSRIYSSQCLYMENAVSGIHFSTLWSKKLPSHFSVMGYLSYIRISKKVCRCFDYSVHPPHYSVQVILCTLRRILLRHSHTSSFRKFLDRAYNTTFLKVRIWYQNSSNSPANIDLFKVRNRNTRKWCEMCSKLALKTPDVFIVNFEHISHPFLMFLLLTLSK